MSSSSVCQGLQSCLEPLLMEPRVLRLKLAPAKSNFSLSVAPSSCFAHVDNLKTESHTEENNTTITTTNNKNDSDDCDVKSHKTDDKRGWSFLQFLANNSQNNAKENTEKEKVYVHPLVKRSSSALSGNSLEMCTESLGSETGSQVSESSGDDISLISPGTEISTTTDTSKLRQSLMTKRTNRSVSFPPPLTSISGSSGVQVRPHREGGRLVLQAVTVTSSQTYFHAERSDGRLRLCLVKDRPANMDDQEEEEEEEEEGDDDDDPDEEFGEEECNEESEEDEVYWDEDMEGKSEKIRGQIGIKKLPRPSRCKEGGRENKGLLNWEPFLVAT